MGLVTKPSRKRSTDIILSLQQVFISFVNFYQRFIQGFNRIIISLTIILKISGLSFILAFRVDENKVVGGDGVGAEGDESVNGSDASRKKLTKSQKLNEKWVQLYKIPRG